MPFLLATRSMRLVLPVHGGRISPVLDVARRFVVVEAQPGTEREQHEELLDEAPLVVKAQRIVQLGTCVLICGAVSRQLESMLTAAGVQVIPNRCGAIEEIIEAYVAGELTDRAFLMPGCTGRQRRRVRFRRRGDTR